MPTRSDRPRIWLTPAILARLRAEATANSPRWQSLKGICDASLGIPPDNRNYASAYDHALVWQVTGNPRYADKAISITQLLVDRGMAALFQSQGSVHGLDVPWVLSEAAVTYDWCRDRLQDPVRAIQWRAQMEQWANWVWPETNPARVGGWSVENPGDNFYHGFMVGVWLVGLSLHGESTKAQTYLDICQRRWEQQARPFFDQFQAGGYMLEGTYYGTLTTGRIMQYLAAHLTATGEDLLNAASFTWPANAVYSRIHMTAPSLGHRYPGGDQPNEAGGYLRDLDRLPMLVALAHLDPLAAASARGWLDRITPNRNQDRWNQWQEFLWYHTEGASTALLPTGYHAEGAGWMTARSDWTSDAVQVHMVCGPTREAHQDRAQGTWMLWAGEDWLAATARLYGGYGLLREAADNNAITVAGQGQPEPGAELGSDLPHVLHFEDTPTHAHFAGEASNAYTQRAWPTPVRLLKEWRRELLFVKPNFVVLLDRVEKVNAADPVTWHLNMKNEPALIGTNLFKAKTAGANLFLSTVMGGGTPTAVPVHHGPGSAVSSWRIDVTAGGAHREFFLHVFEIAPLAQVTATPIEIDSQALRYHTLTFGPHTVAIDLDATGPTMMTLGAPEPPPPDPSDAWERARAELHAAVDRIIDREKGT